MERKAIYFNYDVTLLELEEILIEAISKDSGVTDIVIGGSLLEDDEDDVVFLDVPANLWILGDLQILTGCTVKVHGDFYCTGDIDAYQFNVNGDFTCEGNADITLAQVGGDVTINGNVADSFAYIRCLGDFTCYGNCNANVLVRGFFLCEGEFTGEVKKL